MDKLITEQRMKILHLILHKKWFDKILNGEKKEEYRDIKPYYNSRLSKQYDAILFRNGYSQNARKMLVRLLRITTQRGNYVLHLGEIIERW